MPVKLTYFDARGLAEPIRLIMAYGDIDYEDVRVPVTCIPAQLPPEMKPSFRWGQVPVAEFEGKTIAQSLAITRYFAKKANLVPKDDFQAALVDEYVDSVKDFIYAVYPVVMTQDATERKKKLDEVTKVVKPKFLDVFDSIIKKNDGKHLVGNSLTWADIYLAHFLNNFKIVLDKDFSDGYTYLKIMKDTVLNHPKIKAWMAKRPQTKF